MFFKQSEYCDEECFICCSIHGKTQQEQIYDEFVNRKNFNYPLITLKYAYNCDCKYIYAHNRCLFGINKCPTCRKRVYKPQLYVSTNYDIWFKSFFDWIKKRFKKNK